METEQQNYEYDESLKSKRNALSITSTILFCLSLTGAKIEEANTFIFKISIENQNGIYQALIISIIFLLIRYNSCAHKYINQLHKDWTSDLLNRDFFKKPYEDQFPPYFVWSGALIDLIKEDIDLNMMQNEKPIRWSAEYTCKTPFLRYINYFWTDSYGNPYEKEINILIKKPTIYPRILREEIACQILHFFLNRQHLDIYTPYLISAIAILTYLSSDSLIKLLTH